LLATWPVAEEGATPGPRLRRMVLSDRVWSTSASSNWGRDEVHGLIWAAEVCGPADRRRPDSRRPWQSLVSSFADDGITCGWHASRRVWKLWAIGLPVCGAVEGVSDKIFSTSMTRDEQPLCGPSNSGSAFSGAISGSIECPRYSVTVDTILELVVHAVCRMYTVCTGYRNL
jgi:hypothetical protein